VGSPPSARLRAEAIRQPLREMARAARRARIPRWPPWRLGDVSSYAWQSGPVFRMQPERPTPGSILRALLVMLMLGPRAPPGVLASKSRLVRSLPARVSPGVVRRPVRRIDPRLISFGCTRRSTQQALPRNSAQPGCSIPSCGDRCRTLAAIIRKAKGKRKKAKVRQQGEN
jgi:hypothetical protein